MKSQAARAAAPFYPLSDFRVFVSATSKLNPLEFPPYLALSHNFHAHKWWEKRPTISGEACNDAQGRLCEVESFTGLYRP